MSSDVEMQLRENLHNTRLRLMEQEHFVKILQKENTHLTKIIERYEYEDRGTLGSRSCGDDNCRECNASV